MRFWLLAATIAFSTFALVSIALSYAMSWLGPRLAGRLAHYSAGSRASLLFHARMVPAAAAALVSFGIVLPIYLAYEPPQTGESVARTLVAIGLAGAALLLRGAWRAAAAWRATEAVRRDWLARGRRLEAFATRLPLYAIDETFPTVAVIGVIRPVLFISERVLGECTADEIVVMLRHEAAHVTVGDNLKRFLMRASPDAMRQRSALERAWASAAEEAADAAAAAARPGSAIELAQALIRVARLAPTGRTPELASAFYLGGSIESRVRRLIAATPAPDAPMRVGYVLLAAATLSLAAFAFVTAPALHQAMELLISTLP